MEICQILFEKPQSVSSGAALRNEALYHGFSSFANVTKLYVQPYMSTPDWHPKRGRSFVGADLGDELLGRLLADVEALQPDLVTVEGVYLAQIARSLGERGVRVALDMHNVEADLREEIDRRKGSILNKLFAPIRYRKRWDAARAFERDTARAAQLIWLCSETDRARLIDQGVPAASLFVIPNPAPVVVEPRPQTAQWPPSLLYVGHLSYEPNIDAAQRLLRDILPATRVWAPSAQLTIAGRAPHRKLRAEVAQRSGVTLVPNPPDLAPFYSAASVAVVPLHIGGGTRLKILEAMAWRLPVVASAKAVEGLDLQHRHDFILANETADYVSALQELAAHPELRNQLTENASSFVQMNHSPQAISDALHSSIATLS